MSVLIDQNKAKAMNLGVLQRNDPAIEEILATASHVTLYEFDLDKKCWGRKDVEGSLFVVKRTEQPRFQFIVLNRRSPENLVEDLLGDFECDVQVPYLLYRNCLQEINGIWFYHKQECEVVAKLFTRILSAFGKHHPKPPVLKPPREEFSELEAPLSQELTTGSLEPEMEASAPPPVFGPGRVHSIDSIFNAVQQRPPKVLSSSNLTAVQSVPLSLIESTMQSTAPHQPQIPVSSQGPEPTPLSAPHSNLNPTSPRNAPVSLLPPAFFQSVVEETPPEPLGAPLLQPFPPPSPPLSLASSQGQGFTVSRQSLKAAIIHLAQDERFIDLLLEKLKDTHVAHH